MTNTIVMMMAICFGVVLLFALIPAIGWRVGATMLLLHERYMAARALNLCIVIAGKCSQPRLRIGCRRWIASHLPALGPCYRPDHALAGFAVYGRAGFPPRSSS